jgi:tetratricopeptide (TPR) repeat protein
MKNNWLGLVILFSATLIFADESCIKNAQKLMDLRNYDSVLAVVSNCPPEMSVTRIKGIAYHHLYKADSAVALLKQVVEAGKTDDIVLVNYAEALLWKKDFKSAGAALEMVKDTARLDYKKVFALRLEMLGKIDEAIIWYEWVIRLEKQPWSAMVHKAVLLSWKKKYGEALGLLNQVLDAPNAPKAVKLEARLKKAELISWQGKIKEALLDIDMAIATVKNPGQAELDIKTKILDAYLLKGKLLEWQGEYPHAKETYKDIMLIDPNNSMAKLNLERLLWVK